MTELSRSEKTRITIIKNIQLDNPRLSDDEAWEIHLKRQSSYGFTGGSKSSDAKRTAAQLREQRKREARGKN